MSKLLISCLISLLFVACQSTPSRAPNMVKADYDPEKVALLKWAAEHHILFQIQNASFEDVKSSSLSDSCKKLGSPAWSDAAYKALNTLKSKPELQDRIHVIEIKKSLDSYASTSQDLDGLTYLIIGYKRVEKLNPVQQLEDIPCNEKSVTYLHQDKTDVSFELPSEKNIVKAVSDTPKKDAPDRWNFKTQFLNYLAERQTIFKVNPELIFERSPDGESFLMTFLNTQSDQIAAQNFSTFEYWLNELSLRSHSAAYLKIFSLAKDKDLNFGMGSWPQSWGLSYPYLTYKVNDGHYSYPSLTQLDKCLNELSARYKRSLASISTDLSTQPENFLFPGYSCR